LIELCDDDVGDGDIDAADSIDLTRPAGFISIVEAVSLAARLRLGTFSCIG
jgi:hypothetical protein